MKRYFAGICLAVCMGLFSLNSMGTPILVEDESEDIVVAAAYLYIFEDTTQKITAEEISSGMYDSRFYQRKELSKVQQEDITYWLRFEVKGVKKSSKRWVLEVLDFHIGYIEVYVKTDEGVRRLNQAGYDSPFQRRIYPHKNFIYDMPLEELTTFYMKIRSTTHNPFFFEIRSTGYFSYYALNEYYFLGIYYGILFIMAIYNGMLYIYVREKLYLYYVLYVATCILVSYSEDGLGFQYIWGAFPWINRFLDNFSLLFFLLCFVLYSTTFLEIRRHTPSRIRWLNIILGLGGAYFFLNLFVPVYTPGFTYFLFVAFVIIYAAAFRIYVKGLLPVSGFFLYGYSFTMVGLVNLLLRKNGIATSSHPVFVYSLNIGLLVEVVFFSLALAHRLRKIKEGQEEAQERLIKQLQENEKIITQKVIERTEEIGKQKEVIEQKNEMLEEQTEELRTQALEIQRMNKMLNQENEVLQNDVKALTKARVLMKDVDFNEFSQIFPDEDACYTYLVDLKWREGFACIKCENTKFTKGQGHHARRCSKCGYNESCTVNTIFHRNHIPIVKAFYMLFLVYANQGDITSAELSSILSLRQATCWKFSKKITGKMKENKNLSGRTDLDGWGRLVLD